MSPFAWNRNLLRLDRLTSVVIATCVWSALATAESPAPGDSPRVVILSGPQRSYRQSASALQQALEQRGCVCVFIEMPKDGNRDEPAVERARAQLAEAKPAVIAAAGPAATSLALEAAPRAPVVFFMVPNALDASFWAKDQPDRARLSGVAADVSPAEYIRWITELHPTAKNVAVLHSRRTRQTVKALKQAARARGLVLRAIEADKSEFPRAIETLNETGCGGVLMIPDARVYNAATVQRLLLWGLRRKKPVWGFSPGIVKAGALAGQYPDSKAVGRQAAEMVQHVLQGASPSELGLQYPRDPGRSVNERTVHVIDVLLNTKVITSGTVCFGERS